MPSISHDTMKAFNNFVANLYRHDDMTGMASHVINELQPIIPFESAALFHINPVTKQFNNPVFIDLDPSRFTEYSEYYESYDEFKRTIYGLKSIPMVEKSTDFLDYLEWKRNEHFADFLRPQNIHYLAGLEIFHKGEVIATVSLHRDKNHKDFTKDEIFMLSLLSPHLTNIISNLMAKVPSPPSLDTVAEHFNLTNREREVLKLITAGHSNKDIGELLKISTNTVKVHTKRIFQKASVGSRSQLLYTMSQFVQK